jgi:hypothetical protein
MQCRNTWFKKKSQSLYIRKQHYVDLLFYLFWRLSYSDILYIYGLFIIEVHIMCCDIVCVCVTMLGINMWIHQLTCNFKDDITNGRHTYSRGRRGPDIVVVSLIGRGNRSTWWKPPTCHKSDKLYHIMLYREHLTMYGGEKYMTIAYFNL